MMKKLFQWPLTFCALIGTTCNYAIDSSGVAPLTSHPFLQTFVLSSSTIPQIIIANSGLTPLYVYFDTNQKQCPSGMAPLTETNLSSITTTGTVQSFILNTPFGRLPSPTWQMGLPAFGAQGFKLYGPGYYQSFAIEIDIIPQSGFSPYPVYADMHYTFYCMTNTPS